ncbi:MAG: hypothetical protein QNK37_00950 [Acidobacteriota bacterium]|nr:hypothetical protein [Acidobacteriota bacterium]
MELTKGLIVQDPWCSLILAPENPKCWEIRGSSCNIRGRIGIIKSGTGMVFGVATLVDAFPVTLEDLAANIDKHKVEDPTTITYRKPHAWVLEDPICFRQPIPSNHKRGAVIWPDLRLVVPDEVLPWQL